jgi:predicted homoserine dehydrogenase-like protein
MVTSFADGSKISFEQTIVANATGVEGARRGMSRGVKFDGKPLELPSLYDIDEVRELGVRDRLHRRAGGREGVRPRRARRPQAAPLPEPLQARPGPLYPFWIPYHMPTIETPNAIARVVLFGDELAPPLGGPSVEVYAVAKRDLKAGETLDDYGMFMTYGEAANAEDMCSSRLLPEGLVAGCRLVRDIPQDQALTYDDVELAGRPPRRSPARRAVPPLLR